jgi:hypothetical protein
MKYEWTCWGELKLNNMKYIVEPKGGPTTAREVRDHIKYATAIFPVRTLGEQAEQQQRAKELCDYLNMLEEAKAEATKTMSIATAVAKRLDP